MAHEFTVGIDYHQIAVFDPTLREPFNGWTDVHVRQGFSWRHGSVSFGTLSQSGQFRVIVSLRQEAALPDGTIRAIAVPFTVDSNGIEVGGVFDGVTLEIPSGDSRLVFAAQEVPDQEAEVYHFQFIQAENSAAQILVADAELDPPDELCMTAEPA